MRSLTPNQKPERLNGVHQDLVRVVLRANDLATTENDFMVLEGVRSKETMWTYWGKGRTAAQCKAKGVPVAYAQPKLSKVTWLNNPLMSNHRVQEGGGRAVDLAPIPIDWNDHAGFTRVALLMFRAAAIEGVQIRWGADWDRDGNYREKGETDSPHFELV